MCVRAFERTHTYLYDNMAGALTSRKDQNTGRALVDRGAPLSAVRLFLIARYPPTIQYSTLGCSASRPLPACLFFFFALVRRSCAQKNILLQTKLLVVTDVAARGIDVPLLNNVINYAFPPAPKLFVHRVGRAARQGRTGTVRSVREEREGT